MPRSEGTCHRAAHSFVPKPVSFSIPWRQLIQGPESLRDLQQRRQIWQPKFRTDVRVLTSQFLAIKTVSWTLIQRSTLSFKKNKSYLGLFGLFSLFRLYLAERWVNSTELSSFLIFFHVFLILLPYLGFIHSCRQVKIHRIYHHQWLEGWSNKKNPFKNYTFSNAQWGRHTLQEKRTLPPP